MNWYLNDFPSRRSGQASCRASVLPKTGHGFFQDVPLLPGNVQFTLETLDFGLLGIQTRFALPRKGDHTFLITDLNPATQQRFTQSQVARDLAECHVRLLGELDGFLFELGSERTTFAHG